ncbi:MAG: arsenosugar biosynthesis radical SAM protein ArsS [Deltaproteobacteria bacterium]|nr:arsenosugar biosynthesis radical SAM protein ArsS [Deltaproteobacteria bacterium]
MHLPLYENRPVNRFSIKAQEALGDTFRSGRITTLQINVGKVCNQACKHCHVDAGPNRTEAMDEATAERCLGLLERHRFPVFDITGGAPELNPYFRRMVTRARGLGVHVLVRHNLTVMFERGQEDLPEFFAAHDVEVVSSLPHYTSAGTDRQRGGGVFEESIAAMKRLNALGYGTGRRDRVFHLMHNPLGAFLPGSQKDLERDYRRELARYGVTFDGLFALTNMPIRRFRDWLEKAGQLDDYQAKLEAAFNPAAVAPLMCRSTVSVSYDGKLYDCDFNQMLDLTVADAPSALEDFDLEALERRRIVTDNHCFGCTAGAGSSCGGQTA